MPHATKEARNEYSQLWKKRTNHPQKYYQENKERIREHQNNVKTRDPQAYLIWKTRASAKKRGIPFELCKEDLEIPEVCPILRTPFEFNTDRTMTVDRIDNSKGYVRGNVQIISMKANTMKSNASVPELLLFAKWIGEYFGEPSRILEELEGDTSLAEEEELDV